MSGPVALRSRRQTTQGEMTRVIVGIDCSPLLSQDAREMGASGTSKGDGGEFEGTAWESLVGQARDLSSQRNAAPWMYGLVSPSWVRDLEGADAMHVVTGARKLAVAQSSAEAELDLEGEAVEFGRDKF